MYLYVIGPEKGPHKIGFSSDPVKRLAALQSGNADIIICHAVSKNDCAPRYERELQDRFKSNRIAGEWFSN